MRAENMRVDHKHRFDKLDASMESDKRVTRELVPSSRRRADGPSPAGA